MIALTKKGNSMAELKIHEEWFEGEEKPRNVLYCSKCGFSYSIRHDVSKYCTECGEKIENEKPYGTTPVVIVVNEGSDANV